MPPDARSFMERVAAGEIDNPEAEILNEIDLWAAGSRRITLDDYLGMSPDEYSRWVRNSATIMQLVEKRRAP